MASVTFRSRLWLTTSKSAAASKDRAVCHLFSPDRSECHPFISIEGNAARTGIAVKKVTCKKHSPRESPWTIFGSQNPKPYSIVNAKKPLLINCEIFLSVTFRPNSAETPKVELPLVANVHHDCGVRVESHAGGIT